MLDESHGRARAARLRSRRFVPALLFLALAAAACNPRQPAAERSAAPAAPAASAPQAPPQADPRRDLSIDESMGGHTLARHVGKSDAELAERLRREPQISAASTYVDRPTAERTVAAALTSGGGQLAAWLRRQGRRPNLVLHYTDRRGPPLGRTLGRSGRESVPCHRAIVVLRWDERRDRYYVLTSYPEADR